MISWWNLLNFLCHDKDEQYDVGKSSRWNDTRASKRKMCLESKLNLHFTWLSSRVLQRRIFSLKIIKNYAHNFLSLSLLHSGDHHSLGILDIPGFECFAHDNSLDQFLVNITNEQMQFFYNQRVFMWEMVSHIFYLSACQQRINIWH